MLNVRRGSWLKRVGIANGKNGPLPRMLTGKSVLTSPQLDEGLTALCKLVPH
jgi:hypothetical protein